MKRITRVLIALTAIVPMFLTTANAAKHEGIVVSSPAAAVAFTRVIDLSNWDKFSVQAVYSDGTPAVQVLNSGSRAAATITVTATPTNLIGAQASATVNVTTITSLSGKSVTVGGNVFVAGTDFTVGASSIATATNLAAKINATRNFNATASGSTVTVKYAYYGTTGNGITLSAESPLSASASTLTGGLNRHTITINGVTLAEGSDFNANSSSITVAANITTAINASTSLRDQVVATTATTHVVTVTARAPGHSNYSITSSTSDLLTSGGFPNGAASDVDLTNDIITKASHGFTTGLRVLLATTVGTAPTGLTTGTTYYAIKVNDDRYKLATSSTNAVAGTAVDITAVTNNSTANVTPLALSLAAGNGFYWEASNNGTNFTTLTGVSINGVTNSSFTYSAAGNSIWDFGQLGYKYLRINFTPPTAGGITLNLKIYGKKD